MWWFLEGFTSIFMLEYWLNHLVSNSIFRHLMAFGGLGEQDIGGRDAEAWFEVGGFASYLEIRSEQ